MRISIDATTLILPSAGVKNYMYYWLRSLEKAAGLRGDVIQTYPPRLRVSTDIDHWASRTSFTAGLQLKIVQLANIRGNPLLDLVLCSADLHHCSQHMARLPRRIRTTATIFDFSCWTTPENHTAANIAATKRYAEKILKHADGLIAISAHARNDAVEILHIPEQRIRVIYPGIAEGFFQVTDEEAAPIRARYALPSTYMLFVGCIEPRKNVPGLIRAYQQLPETIRRDVPLVVAGPFGWEDDIVRSLLSTNEVRYLGYVPEAELPGLFRGAAAFVYPSYYEGFGLPVAQAMAAGVPVITSNRSCLPEVVGRGGLVVDPASTDALMAAMEHVLTCSDAARDLALEGRSRAELYRWPACASASLEWFHEIHGRR
jgi:glycosyltransferase involved in cell wall biosynthesis